MGLLPCLYPELTAFYCQDTLTKIIYCDSICLLPCLYPELTAFYCQDTLTKIIYCDSIWMPTI